MRLAAGSSEARKAISERATGSPLTARNLYGRAQKSKEENNNKNRPGKMKPKLHGKQQQRRKSVGNRVAAKGRCKGQGRLRETAMTGILSMSGNVNIFFFPCSQRDKESNAGDSHRLSRGVKEIMEGLQVKPERAIRTGSCCRLLKIQGKDSAPEDLSSELGEAGAVLDGRTSLVMLPLRSRGKVRQMMQVVMNQAP